MVLGPKKEWLLECGNMRMKMNEMSPSMKRLVHG
jgi:hypothetical protein